MTVIIAKKYYQFKLYLTIYLECICGEGEGDV